jgi:hypothetical protein
VTVTTDPATSEHDPEAAPTSAPQNTDPPVEIGPDFAWLLAQAWIGIPLVP